MALTPVLLLAVAVAACAYLVWPVGMMKAPAGWRSRPTPSFTSTCSATLGSKRGQGIRRRDRDCPLGVLVCCLHCHDLALDRRASAATKGGNVAGVMSLLW